MIYKKPWNKEQVHLPSKKIASDFVKKYVELQDREYELDYINIHTEQEFWWRLIDWNLVIFARPNIAYKTINNVLIYNL